MDSDLNLSVVSFLRRFMRLMLLIAGIIWALLVLTTPLALLKTAYDSYIEQAKKSRIILKLLVAFLAYFLVSYFTFWLLLLSLVGAEPRRPGQEMPLVEKITFLILVLIYGIIAWLLCSFIRGKAMLWSVFWFKTEKPPSIFEAD